MNEIITLDNLQKAKMLIYECRNIDELKKIRDQAEALSLYAQKQKLGFDIQNDILDINARTNRRIGELSKLIKTAEYKGNQYAKSEVDTKQNVLKEAGLSKQEANRCEKIADIPEKKFEAIISNAKIEHQRISQNLLVSIAKEAAKAERIIKENKDRVKKVSGIEIRKGDFKVVLADVYGIDAIVTDPPYVKESLHCFSDLSKYAARHVKKDGFIAVYSGQYHLPEVIKRLSEHLTYVWTFCLYHVGKKQLVNGVNIMCGWKPVLIFSNGRKKMRFPAYDVLISEAREKSSHEWQQSESGVYGLIDILSKPGDLVVDPFSGSGTFGKVATENGRKFIGAEIGGIK